MTSKSTKTIPKKQNVGSMKQKLVLEISASPFTRSNLT